MTLAIRGTEFAVQADGDESRLTVLEGEVVASNAQGEVPVPAGSAAVARAGEAPQVALVARPRDAVQWSLYYPPIFSAPPGDAPELLEAQRLAAANDIAGALAALHRAPATAGVQAYRASLLLQVGRVDEARAALDAALATDPQDAQAFALRSVIGVVQNERDAALADAQKAVELAPTSAAAKIALSYAQQARFDIEGARATMLQAVEEQPEDALAWARLSELWLMAGYRDRSREAADRAAALAPELDRVQTVRGFADLVEFRTRTASEAFERAIALNSANPLPRFGLGLAQIRDGHLEQGRKTIELAVGLDFSNALLRTYLGKAYFEERRPAPAGDQYQVAKELDPLDPTAYLFEAIRLQSINRPVEALESLSESVRLNDNRAVYRGRLLLDADRAARGASLARVYQDLGFREVGVREATDSLAIDPSNTGAHRFLSDVLIGARRREISRVSELLQAQMLQDININPVQPALSETNLNVGPGAGAGTPGFNEYTALFERDMFQLNGTGLVGNNNTIGGEAVASAVYGRHSINAGAFGYDTDGWRDNNDLRHSIQSVFYQGAITPEFNLQVEFRRRDTNEGDLDFNFDPDDFSRTEERDFNQYTGRVGARFSPDPSSDFLVSLSYTHLKDKLTDSQPTPFGDQQFFGDARDQGYQAEGQYIYRQERFNLVSGGFTTLSERYEDDPEGLTALLSRYFTAMTTIIQEDSGTIDKYIGDAIMAFWNAPLPVEQHARRACDAALRMRAGLVGFNEALAAEAAGRGTETAPLRIGIGLNTGVCFVGNMGSEQRFNYSVIGDPVNVASRIEGRCKTYGLDIVIGETTRDAARDLATLEIDRVRLLGKTTTTGLFALVGDEAVARSERFGELAGEHAAMLETYRGRAWDTAMQKLRRCHHLGQAYGLDDFYEMYGLRIALYMTEPPPPDWDGSIVAEDKH